MHPKTDNGVIILGGHVQGLGILRILGRKRIPGIVIDSTYANLARKSKFCIRFWRRCNEELLDFLISLGKKGRYKNWVVFPSNDFHVRLLSENRKILEPFFILGTDEWKVVRIFYNKKNTYALAEKTGTPFAGTFYPENIDDMDSREISFPCIIKPAVMHEFYRQTGKKVLVCHDKPSLKENYGRALAVIPADEILIQDVIPGPSRNQFSACFLFLQGKTYVHLTACRMRQHPIDYGNATTYAETVDIPILKGYGERILRAANYNGLCEVEFKLDERDGQYKFLEVNTRTWKWHSIANKAQTPFLKTYYDYLTGKEIIPVEGYKSASFRHSVTDLPTQLRLLAGGFDYWKQKRKPVEDAVWAREDMMPWLWEKIYLPHMILTR